MRIAHLESSLNWGGQELRIVEQAQWLNAHGHTCWILARAGSAILAQAQRLDLPCEIMDFSGSAKPGTIRALLRFIREKKIDLIDAHSNRDAAYAMFARWFSPVSVIRSRHVTSPIKDSALYRLIWRFGNHGIVTTAKRVGEMIVNQHLAQWSNIYVATAGVDEKRYRPGMDGSALKAALGIPAHHRVVANIGMIRRDKGQLFFVRACELIAQSDPHVSFIQIGEPTADTRAYADDVARAVSDSSCKDRIRFIGYRDDIERYQAFIDVLMICSIDTEAQTRLVAQAFLMGNAVVATRVGGLPEMITHEKTGLLCEPCLPEALAESCMRLLGDDAGYAMMTRQARAQALSEMTFDHMMRGMLTAYRKAADRMCIGE